MTESKEDRRLHSCDCGGDLSVIVEAEQKWIKGELQDTWSGEAHVWCSNCDEFSDHSAPEWCDVQRTIDYHLGDDESPK